MEHRNIIVIGPKNTGKSTIASKILMQGNYPYQPKDITVRKTEKLICNVDYKITILDTVGHTTASMSREGVRHLKEHLRRNNIDVIHLVLFVIRAGRLSGDDKRILESIMAEFRHPQLANISALAITHCEQYNDKKRQDIIMQFRRDNYTSRISNLMRGGIITTGFASTEEYYQGFGTLEAENKTDLENVDNIIAKAVNGVETNELFRSTNVFEELCKSCIIL